MGVQGSTFWLLDGRTGWRTDYREKVSVDNLSGLSLAANPAGPLSLSSSDGSMGGLILPRGMAFDEKNDLYLLDKEESWIKRFDPGARQFQRLPTVGGIGEEPRQFREPTNIAVTRSHLFVADLGNHRVQVFHLPTLALLWVWQLKGIEGSFWEPADVSAAAGVAFILDRSGGRILRHRIDATVLEVVVDDRKRGAGRWSRLALDREGRIYLLDLQTPVLDIYDKQGVYQDSIQEAGDVRNKFDAPVIRLDHKSRFCLPESLAGECPRQPGDAPPEANPLYYCLPSLTKGLLFDRRGEPVRVNPAIEPLGPRYYETEGVWISQALDSKLYRCQWHRVELEIGTLPPGTQITVSTHTDSEKKTVKDFYNIDHLWETKYSIIGQMQPGKPDEVQEFLVQSREGQYLWLKIQLRGDGYATPLVRSTRVHYPRESYLEYLPAIYSADDESRRFLERFLSIFQTEWDGVERLLEKMARCFDPEAVPAKFVDYLAGWLALPLEETWSAEQKRRLLAAVPRLYSKRGTVAGIREYIRIYLQNLTGLPPEEQLGYPQIVEGFQERQHLLLSSPGLADLGRSAPLWGLDLVGRLQLDVFDREGEVRLVSTGDPLRDFFNEYAHRFKVFIPSVWVSTATDESLLRRALDEEKPAHTKYDLCLVEPRFRVGVQATLGIDTIIGGYPAVQLPCSESDDQAPPSRLRRCGLGYDTILDGVQGVDAGLRLTPGLRLGPETILT